MPVSTRRYPRHKPEGRTTLSKYQVDYLCYYWDFCYYYNYYYCYP